MGVVFYFFYNYKNERLLFFIIFLLGIRITFNWFVLPIRLIEDKGSKLRQMSTELGKITTQKDLYIVRGVELEKTNAFYITNARQKIINTKKRDQPHLQNAWYIADPEYLNNYSTSFKEKHRFPCRHNEPYYRVVAEIED